MLLDLSST